MAYVYDGEYDYAVIHDFGVFLGIARRNNIEITEDILSKFNIREVKLDKSDVDKLVSYYEPSRVIRIEREFGVFTFNYIINGLLFSDLLSGQVRSPVAYIFLGNTDNLFTPKSEVSSIAVEILQKAASKLMYYELEDSCESSDEVQAYVSQVGKFIECAQELKEKYGNILFSFLVDTGPATRLADIRQESQID